MAKITVRLSQVPNLKAKLDTIKREFARQNHSDIAVKVVKEMKDLVSKGISPIKSVGRFEAYKNPVKYPGKVIKNFPQKRERPVNLKLTGKFLNDLVGGAIQGGFTIGFKSEESNEKEQGHREGANGQKKRPIIPAKNEQFAESIKRIIVDATITKINSIISRIK